MLYFMIYMLIGVILIIGAVAIDKNLTKMRYFKLAVVFFVFLWPVFMFLAFDIEV